MTEQHALSSGKTSDILQKIEKKLLNFISINSADEVK